MRDVLEGIGMALLFIAVLCAAYLLAVFIIAGANFEAFVQIIESLWSSSAASR